MELNLPLILFLGKVRVWSCVMKYVSYLSANVCKQEIILKNFIFLRDLLWTIAFCVFFIEMSKCLIRFWHFVLVKQNWLLREISYKSFFDTIFKIFTMMWWHWFNLISSNLMIFKHLFCQNSVQNDFLKKILAKILLLFHQIVFPSAMECVEKSSLSTAIIGSWSFMFN